MTTTAALTSAQILDLCDDANVRAVTIIHIASMLHCGELDRDEWHFESFASDLPDLRPDLVTGFLVDIRAHLIACSEEGDFDEEDAMNCMVEFMIDRRRMGFLLYASTPVREPGSSSYSPELTTACWFYGDTYDEAIQQAAAWATAYAEGIAAQAPDDTCPECEGDGQVDNGEGTEDCPACSSPAPTSAEGPTNG